MQNKRIGKGAAEKKYCALFLSVSEKKDSEKTENGMEESSFKELEVTEEKRRSLKKILKIYRPSLLVIGIAGKAEAALLAAEKEDELRERFPAWLTAQVMEQKEGEEQLLEKLSKVLKDGGEYAPGPDFPPVLFPVKKGGLLAAFWELGEALGCGMQIQQGDIPMKQSVIEICNLYQINPYECDDEGVWLMVCKNGKQAESLLKQAGLTVRRVGQITEKPERVLLTETETRFLNNPRL